LLSSPSMSRLAEMFKRDAVFVSPHQTLQANRRQESRPSCLLSRLLALHPQKLCRLSRRLLPMYTRFHDSRKAVINVREQINPTIVGLWGFGISRFGLFRRWPHPPNSKLHSKSSTTTSKRATSHEKDTKREEPSSSLSMCYHRSLLPSSSVEACASTPPTTAIIRRQKVSPAEFRSR
jgi:hypothetical protein